MLGEVGIKLFLDTAGFDGEVRRSERELGSLGQRLNSTARTLTRTVAASFAAATAAAAAFTASSVAVGAGFERSISRLRSLQQGVDITPLIEEARTLGATTQFSASQAAEALIVLAQGGNTVEESLERVGAVLDFAAAQGVTLAQSAELVSAAMTQFSSANLSAEQTTDILTATASNSQATFERLRAGLAQAGETAGALGLDFARTNAILGEFINVSGDGARSGTALRNILQTSAAASAQAEEALRGVGLSLADIDAGQVGIGGLFENLARSTIDANSAVNIFGRESSAAVIGLVERIRTEAVDLDEIFSTIADSSGDAARQAAVANDNLIGDFTRLSSAFEAAQISLSESFGPGLRTLTQQVSEFFSDLAAAFGELDVEGDITSQFQTIADFLDDSGDRIIEVIVTLIEDAVELGSQLQELAPLLQTLADGFLAFAQLAADNPVLATLTVSAVGLSREFSVLSLATQSIAEPLAQASGRLRDSQGRFLSAAQAARLYGTSAAEAALQTSRYSDAALDALDATGRLPGPLARMSAGLSSAGSATSGLLTALVTTPAAIAALAAGLAIGVGALAQYVAASQEATREEARRRGEIAGTASAQEDAARRLTVVQSQLDARRADAQDILESLKDATDEQSAALRRQAQAILRVVDAQAILDGRTITLGGDEVLISGLNEDEAELAGELLEDRATDAELALESARSAVNDLLAAEAELGRVASSSAFNNSIGSQTLDFGVLETQLGSLGSQYGAVAQDATLSFDAIRDASRNQSNSIDSASEALDAYGDAVRGVGLIAGQFDDATVVAIQRFAAARQAAQEEVTRLEGEQSRVANQQQQLQINGIQAQARARELADRERAEAEAQAEARRRAAEQAAEQAAQRAAQNRTAALDFLRNQIREVAETEAEARRADSEGIAENIEGQLTGIATVETEEERVRRAQIEAIEREAQARLEAIIDRVEGVRLVGEEERALEQLRQTIIARAQRQAEQVREQAGAAELAEGGQTVTLDFTEGTGDGALQARLNEASAALQGTDEQANALKDTFDELGGAIRENFDAIAGAFANLGNSIAQAVEQAAQLTIDQSQARVEAREGEAEANAEAAEAQIQADLEAGRINEQVAERRRAEAQETAAAEAAAAQAFAREERQLQQDAFERQKQAQIAQALIEAAQGALAVVTQSIALGPIAGPVFAALAGPALAVSTATQLAAIEAQQFPSFASGIEFVPHDMIARLHEGERVVTAHQNRAEMALGRTMAAPREQGLTVPQHSQAVAPTRRGGTSPESRAWQRARNVADGGGRVTKLGRGSSKKGNR